jgi:hypothetical protein
LRAPATTDAAGAGFLGEHRDAPRRRGCAEPNDVRRADFCVYRIALDKPIEVDPDAAEDNLGELFVRSPSGAVLEAVDEIER